MSRHLEITTYIDCPNRCAYCPQETLIKAYSSDAKEMSIETFRRILLNVPPDVDIHFSGFSELFYNQNALQFIDEASKNHEVVIYTTTKGMTDEVALALGERRFKQFVVHDNLGARQFNFPHERVNINASNKISRGGHLWDSGTREKGTCINSASFQQNVVLPNGDVYLCCMDYGLEHRLGNLLETHFDQLNRANSYDICKKCEKYR